jgi:hypothetical protein
MQVKQILKSKRKERFRKTCNEMGGSIVKEDEADIVSNSTASPF